MALQAGAQAPNISYSSPQVYNPFITVTPLSPTNTGGAVPASTSAQLAAFNNVTGVAVDRAGNLYVAENGSNDVRTITDNVVLTIGSGFNKPTGVAVDTSGNVFVADYGNNAVKEIPANGGAVITLASGFNGPYGIAIDAAGNLYISDANNNQVKELQLGNSTPIILAGGFNHPAGVALDASGNVYVADRGNNAIKKILPGGSVVTLASGNGNPNGVAVDQYGNVYFADTNNTSITIIPAGGNPAFSVGSGFIDPNSLALDNKGNVFVGARNTTISDANPVDGVSEFKFGTYAISPALPFGLGMDETTGVISGTPIRNSPAKNYTITAYNSSGSSSAVVNIAVSAAQKPNISYSTPQYFTVGTPVSLAPANTGGTVPPQQSFNLYSGYGGITGIAIDNSQNVYLCQYQATYLFKIPANGGRPVTVASGFTSLKGVTIDPNGNLFVVDGAVVKKISASDGAITTIASGFNSPFGIAIDASGNLYVSDTKGNSIKKIPVGGASVITLVTGLNTPTGIAVDAAGNVYVADNGDGTIKKIATGSSSAITVATGFNRPLGSIAVDAKGNLYVGDQGNSALKFIPAGGGIPYAIAQSTGFKNPLAVALDNMGNIYVDDSGLGKVLEINPGYQVSPALPAGLSIDPGTGIISGIPTTISPATDYTVSAQNSGGISLATVQITVNPYQLPAISYASPQVYAENVAITPLVPKSSAVFPQSSARSITTLAGNLHPVNDPIGDLAVDASGNVYVSLGDSIIKINSNRSRATTIGSGFKNVTGIAVDGAGNIYIVDSGNHAVDKIPAGGGAPVTISTNFNSPFGIAIDASGNLYIADKNHTIYKIPAGSNSPVVLDGTDFVSPIGIAVDGWGNLYVADAGTGLVYKIPAGGGSAVKLMSDNSFGGGGFIYSVAVDVAGNVFFTYSTDNYYIPHTWLYEVPAGSNAPILSPSPDLDLNDPAYLAFDDTGVLYITDGTFSTVYQITPVGGYFLSQVLPAGLNFDGGTGIISGTPTATSPATNYTVTGYNTGGKGAGTVNISVVAGTNTSLTSLAVSAGTLTPAFATSTTNYTVSVPDTVSSITITPTAGDGTASITLNGATVASGTASAAIPLALGANTIGVTVIDNGGTTVSNYTIIVTRVPSSNANLASLTISQGTISPVFAPGTTGYTASFPLGTSSISITPTLADTTARMTVNGQSLASGTASVAIPLKEGPNTIATVVTAQDGTTQTYTLTVTVNPVLPQGNFKIAITSTTCDGTNNGSVTVTAADKLNYTATISGNGLNKPYAFTDSLTIGSLAAGSYSLCITMAAQPGFQQCFDVAITQPQSLSVYAAVDNDSNNVTLALSGGNSYNIKLNGSVYTTSQNSITLPLQKGNNDLVVSTDKFCQGSVEKLINISGVISPYPVPFQNLLNINLGNIAINTVNVNIYNLQSTVPVYSKQYASQSGVLQLDVSSLTNGIYVLYLTLDSSTKIFKIIKQ